MTLYCSDRTAAKQALECSYEPDDILYMTFFDYKLNGR